MGVLPNTQAQYSVLNMTVLLAIRSAVLPLTYISWDTRLSEKDFSTIATCSDFHSFRTYFNRKVESPSNFFKTELT